MENPTIEQIAEDTNIVPLVQALIVLFQVSPPRPQDLAAWLGALIMTANACGPLSEADIRKMIAELLPHE